MKIAINSGDVLIISAFIRARTLMDSLWILVQKTNKPQNPQMLAWHSVISQAQGTKVIKRKKQSRELKTEFRA